MSSGAPGPGEPVVEQTVTILPNKPSSSSSASKPVVVKDSHVVVPPNKPVTSGVPVQTVPATSPASGTPSKTPATQTGSSAAASTSSPPVTTSADSIPTPSSSPSDNKDGKMVDMPETESLASAVERHRIRLEKTFMGWRSFHNNSKEAMRKYLLDAKEMFDLDSARVAPTVLDMYLPGKLNGEWWQNAVLLAVVGVLSWIVSKLWFRWIFLFIIIVLSTLAFGSNMIAMRRTIRDAVIKGLSKPKEKLDFESIDWLNVLVQRIWVMNEPMISQTISTNVENQVSAMLPSFISELSFSTFTLGSKSPRIDGICSHNLTASDVVVIDVKFSFAPNDSLDISGDSIGFRVNPKLTLKAKIALGKLSFSIPITVQDISISGVLRLRFKLSSEFPFINVLSASMLDMPEIYYVVRPIDLPFLDADVSYIPGLNQLIMEQARKVIAPMAFWPNMFDVNLASAMAGVYPGTALGVVTVSLYSARLKVEDPAIRPSTFATVSVGKQEYGRTAVVNSSFSPSFDTTIYAVIFSLNDPLRVDLYNVENGREVLYGTAYLDVRSLYVNGPTEGQDYILFYNAINRGSIGFDANCSPSLFPKKQLDGNTVAPPETSTGILNFTVLGGRGFNELAVFEKKSNLVFTTYINGKKLDSYKLKPTDNPSVNLSSVVYVPSRAKSIFAVEVHDSKHEDKPLGVIKGSCDKLIKKERDTVMFEGFKNSGVSLSASWIPVNVVERKNVKNVFEKVIGVLRINFLEAKNLKNVELPGKKSDPYCRVLEKSLILGKTVYIPNDLNPVWDEILYVPIVEGGEVLDIEVMDHEDNNDDRSLGFVKLDTRKYIQKAMALTEEERVNTLFGSDEFETLNLVSRKDNTTMRGTVTLNCDYRPIVDLKKNPSSESNTDLSRTVSMAPSSASTAAPSLSNTSGARTTAASEIVHGDTITYPSGLATLTIMSTDLQSKNLELCIYVDDSPYPFVSMNTARRASSTNSTFGISMIRDLSTAELFFIVRDGSKRNSAPLAEFSKPAREILGSAIGRPCTVNIPSGQAKPHRVRFSMRYIPCLFTLNPSETIKNNGLLYVNLKRGTDLPIADRKSSDPYTIFQMNGNQVYKSATIKKNLNPIWNEKFDTPVHNRLGSVFKLICYDYDVGGKDDLLGKALVDIADLVIDEEVDLVLPLDGETGSIELSIRFEPKWVRRSIEQRESIVSSAAHLGVNLIKGGFGLAAGGVSAIGGAALSGAGAIGSRAVSGATNLTNGVNQVGSKALHGFKDVGKGVGKGVMAIGDGIFHRKKSKRQVNSAASHRTDATTSTQANSVSNSSAPQSPVVKDVANKVTTQRYVFTITRGSNFPSKPIRFIVTDGFGELYKSKIKKGPSPEWNETVSLNLIPNVKIAVQFVTHALMSRNSIGEVSLSENMLGETTLTVGDATVLVSAKLQ
ncbi:C2 domain-containing protein [Schizosaccharomyces japonicus yFS275]|uniref:C2 domain-containing protein n=1 Tax=Schizosaccharomyces japonicus (strain yFS275 / FY16936) TaxID=402676 RepID=B6K6S5_SCHJY|nr:C2 domain-containing protein [Schizosaccharomyces japonicus yFS275]EEB09229.1 C2 domain-containing protein [Schizosaccharomyces japonicus yFS275]